MTSLKPIQTIFIFLLLIGLAGCRGLAEPTLDMGESGKEELDTTVFQHAIVSGEPVPLSSLKVGQIPEATRCQPIWEQVPVERWKRRNSQAKNTNDLRQRILEHRYKNESTGETWQEYYVDKQLIFRGRLQEEGNFFHAQWVGTGLILFHGEDKNNFFFLFDIEHSIIRLFHDFQWKQIPVNGEPITDAVWNYYDSAVQVSLAAFEEDSGQIIFYVTQEQTTVFEFNPLWPNNVTVLFDNLPTQKWTYSNFWGGDTLLWKQDDGTVWFSVNTGGESARSGLVFRYNGESKVLTPIFTYADHQNCYFYEESMAIRSGSNQYTELLEYDTNTVYHFWDGSEYHVVTNIGPTGHEYLKTYNEAEKKHYLWDVDKNKRYYVTYEDMVLTFPDRDKMIEGDVIEYLHGAGSFSVYRTSTDKLLYEEYNIDWDSTILHPLGSVQQ